MASGYHMSRSVKNLRFYPTCQFTSKHVKVSWMLAEDTRLLGKDKGFHYSQRSRQHEFNVHINSLCPQVPRR